MKIKTADLIGPALNWAVGACESDENFRMELHYRGYSPCVPFMKDISTSSAGGGFYPEYCTDWSHAGPIIEREGIATYLMPGGVGGKWRAEVRNEKAGYHLGAGPTPLIAAMRCYVSVKFGDEIDVPSELKGEQ